MSKIQNIHVPAEQKNLAINGALDFWQEKTSTTTTVNTASGVVNYAADMVAVASFGTNIKNYSFVRSADVPTFSQAGFTAPYSLMFTQITGNPSPAATDQTNPWLYFQEGTDYAKLHGKVVTLGFWVKGTVSGIYAVSIRNNNSDRSYVTNVTLNSANTWEFKTITVTLDNTGTWTFDASGRGLIVSIGSVAGTNQSTNTLNQWQSGNFVSSTTATNWMATNGATLKITMFSIVEGSLGFGQTGFQRAGKSIQQELAMCQRLFYIHAMSSVQSYNAFYGFTDYDNTWRAGKLFFPVQMRAIPSVISPGNSNMYLHKPGIYNNPFASVPGGPPSFSAFADVNSVGYQGTITNANSTSVGFYYTQMIFDARL